MATTGQVHCDWCYRPLTTKSVRQSEEVGLGTEISWACESCLKSGAFHAPPDGWDAPVEEWPFASDDASPTGK